MYISSGKDKTLDAFKRYKNEVKNHISYKIKMIYNNRGGECVALFEELFQEHNIIHYTIAPYSSQSNGIAESKNQIFKEMMNAILINSGLPKIYGRSFALS